MAKTAPDAYTLGAAHMANLYSGIYLQYEKYTKEEYTCRS